MNNQEIQAILNEFEKKWQKKTASLDTDTKQLAVKLNTQINVYNPRIPFVKEMVEEFRTSDCKCPSEFFRKYHAALVAAFVPIPYLEDFYRGIDALNRYPYTRGLYRRTVRTEAYEPGFFRMMMILLAYKQLDMYGGSLLDYLCDRMPSELVELKRSYQKIRYLEFLIAFRLDAKDANLAELMKEMILGENNTAVVTTEVIRGIIMSSHTGLHSLLSDFLLAAQLQEGVRQAICENADCGTEEAFRTILTTICSNNLVRFASVRRAVGTWTGLGDMDGTERVATKVLGCIHAALTGGEKQIAAYTNSNDSVEILCGLWALGFHDVEDALERMEDYLESGTENQLLTMGYYNTMLDYSPFLNWISSQAIQKYPKNHALAAVFMDSFLRNASSLAKDLAEEPWDGEEKEVIPCKKIRFSQLYPSKEEACACFRILYDILKEMPKKKMEFAPVIFPWYRVVLSRNQLIVRMCVTAYALGDLGMLRECCDTLPLIDASDYEAQRAVLLKLLTYNRTHLPKFRETLLSSLVDKEGETRKWAYILVRDMKREEADYLFMEKHLKNKSDDIRNRVLNLLNMQDESGRLESARRLLVEKTPELRMGGISILQSLCEEEKAGKTITHAATVEELIRQLADREDLTESESVVVRELNCAKHQEDSGQEPGYGLYDPNGVFFIEPQTSTILKPQTGAIPKPQTSAILKPLKLLREERIRKPIAEKDIVRKPTEIFPVSEESKQLVEYFTATMAQMDPLFATLEKFYYEHGHLPYRTDIGEEELLANGFFMIEFPGSDLPLADCYPFRELWVEFYETHVKTPELLLQMQIALMNPIPNSTDAGIQRESTYYACLERVLGKTLSNYQPRFLHDRFHRAAKSILEVLASLYPEPRLPELGQKAAVVLLSDIKEDERCYKRKNEADTRKLRRDTIVTLLDCERIAFLLDSMKAAKDEDFLISFPWNYRLDLFYPANQWKKEKFIYYGALYHENRLGVLDFVRAHVLGIIPENEVYKAVFEYSSPMYSLKTLSRLIGNAMHGNEERRYACYRIGNKWDEESAFYKTAVAVYRRIADRMLDVELKRGDLPTVFSPCILYLRYIYGANRMVQVLSALGNTSLNRCVSHYNGDDRESKKVVLSHLLEVSYPEATDSPATLKALLKGRKISENRLYEVMMYAPQWIDILEGYLGKNLKSSCYYFMAHMNEYFDDRKMAVISKFTPLSSDELNKGAFDRNWFLMAHRQAGDAVFQKLYTAAKYISDSNKHARARKYADAALGKMDIARLEEEIKAKRNKDLVMSYGIVPFRDEKDMLHRYEFIEQFRKESRQFGAQRRAGEGIAADMALRNMATNAGYQDEIRLILAMETQLVAKEGNAFAPHTIGDVALCLEVDAAGKVELSCSKGGKPQKSVPAALKKDEYVLYLNDLKKKLKEQYLRSVKMFEKGMEEQEGYTFRELWNLNTNPVIWGIAGNLLFITKDARTSGNGTLCDDDVDGGEGGCHPCASNNVLLCNSDLEAGISRCSQGVSRNDTLCDGNIDGDGKGYAKSAPVIGLLCEGGLVDYEGNMTSLGPDQLLCVAHPYDLYHNQCWNKYQNLFFREMSEGKRKKQPFRQVFRELYVKLPEEAEKYDSRMFAGNQIQPKKTAGCLKGRRWIADYEEGLQKVFYKQNVIAQIYALADWFSPGEVEAPTLEWVVFYDRKTFQRLKIREVPDVVYSEVMRDVDLAVSVAHVGGVDPETSHSTMEMRRVIIRHNLPLFGLDNVTFEGNHVIVTGKLAVYSIHLGSGVIHVMGGPAVHVLPVHSQSGGKLFLPFVDDDPKTAEIMSKIVLFAKDTKLKDPYILKQIPRRIQNAPEKKTPMNKT